MHHFSRQKFLVLIMFLCLHSCLHSPLSQPVRSVCPKGSSIKVQGTTLRSCPVSPCLYQDRKDSSPSSQVAGRLRILNYLDDWLILAHSLDQGPRALAPPPTGPADQLGPEQDLPIKDLFLSRHGTRCCLSPHVGMPYQRARPVNVVLPETFQAAINGPTETFLEAPGACSILDSGHSARFDAYETASTLAFRGAFPGELGTPV